MASSTINAAIAHRGIARGWGGGSAEEIADGKVDAGVDTGAGAEVDDSSRISSNCTFTSAMFCERRAGSLRKHRWTIRSNSAGMPGADWIKDEGSSRITADSVAMRLGPENARLPVSISYSTAPKEKMSERA